MLFCFCSTFFLLLFILLFGCVVSFFFLLSFSLQVFHFLNCACIFAQFFSLCIFVGVFLFAISPFDVSVCALHYTSVCIHIINRPQSVLCVMKIYVIFEINLCLQRLFCSFSSFTICTNTHTYTFAYSIGAHKQ